MELMQFQRIFRYIATVLIGEHGDSMRINKDHTKMLKILKCNLAEMQTYSWINMIKCSI